MVKAIRLAGKVASCSVFLLVLQYGRPVLAGPCLEYPCNDECVCIPNARDFGYFRTVWREWPAELRPDTTFPGPVGVEVIPTPEGQRQLPPPETPGEGPGVEPFLPGGLPGIPDGPQPDGWPPLGPDLPDRLDEPPAVAPQFEPPAVEPPSGPPATEPSAEPPIEDEGPLPTTPNDGAGLPRYAPQSVAAGPVDQNGPDVSGVADNEPWPSKPEAEMLSGDEPEPKPLQAQQPEPKALQANWMAALHPGFRGDAGRTMATYPSMEPVRPVIHHAAVESQPTAAGRYLDGEQPDEQPAGRAEHTPRLDSPPVALDGFCPVELGKNERWTPGDPRWTVVHQGWTYLFCGPMERERFLAGPDRYTPACSGHDPVLVVDANRHVQGQTDYCVTYQGRLYMFSNPVTMARFRKDPKRYAAASSE